MSEIFIGADVEAYGPIPGIHSMLSLGSVAFTVEQTGYNEISSFGANMYELENTKREQDVMAWWGMHQDAWRRCREDCRHASEVMREYLCWIRSLPGPAGLLSYPGSYDAPFINWYMYVFTGILPFGHQALCIKSYAMGMLKYPSWLSFGRNMIPKDYLPKDLHDHTPLSDARKEAQLFAAMYRDNVLVGR